MRPLQSILGAVERIMGCSDHKFAIMAAILNMQNVNNIQGDVKQRYICKFVTHTIKTVDCSQEICCLEDNSAILATILNMQMIQI